MTWAGKVVLLIIVNIVSHHWVFCRQVNLNLKVATHRLEYRAKPKESTQFGSVSGLEIQNLPFSLSGIISLYRVEPKEPT